MKLSEKILLELDDVLTTMENLSDTTGFSALYDGMKTIEKVIKEFCGAAEYKEPAKATLKDAADFIKEFAQNE